MNDFYKENLEDILAVTPMQAGMLFHYFSEQESGVYFDQHCYRMKGIVKIDCLKKAWNYVASNNEMLRTIFRWNETRLPIQIILKKYDIPFSEYDYSRLDTAEKQTYLDEMLCRDRRELVNIETKPYRVNFCKLSDDEYYMIVSAHHIIYDGWSNAILLEELLYAYSQYLKEKKPVKIEKTGYRELIKWYRNQDKTKQKQFWEDYLKGYIAKSFLGMGKAKKSMGESGKYLYRMDEEMIGTVHQFIRREQITLATLIYTAWGILLQKYSGHEDILFGVTMSGRTSDIAGVENIIGLFINTLPMRLKIERVSKIWDILREVNNAIISLEEYQGTPLTNLKKYCSVSIDEQLFDTIVVVQNYPIEVGMVSDDQCMSIEFASSYYVTNFNISMDVRTYKGIQFAFDFDVGNFDVASLEKICDCLVKIIEVIIHDQGLDSKVTDIEIFDLIEESKVLKDVKNMVDHLVGLEEVDFEEIF